MRDLKLRWWEEPFAGEEGRAYERFETSQPFGVAPALVIIDVVEPFVGPRARSFAEIAEEWPAACGPAAHEAIPSIKAVLDSARMARVGAGIPIVHCRPGGPELFGPTVKAERTGKQLACNHPVDFVEQVLPEAGETVLTKSRASAFFDTPLATFLHGQNVDSVLVIGCTTSGCVRATVVDSFSHGYSTFVVEEAVFDRSALSAAVSLFEMNAKYADVIELADAIRWFDSLTDKVRTR